MESNSKISQQKSRRVPIQLHEQVDKKVENLLTGGHIERVEKFKTVFSFNQRT